MMRVLMYSRNSCLYEVISVELHFYFIVYISEYLAPTQTQFEGMLHG